MMLPKQNGRVSELPKQWPDISSLYFICAELSALLAYSITVSCPVDKTAPSPESEASVLRINWSVFVAEQVAKLKPCAENQRHAGVLMSMKKYPLLLVRRLRGAAMSGNLF